jgi:hypothetical protein
MLFPGQTGNPGFGVIIVSGGENPHIDGGRFILDEHQGWQALGSRIVARLRVEGAAVLTAVQDASRRCAVPFGPP